MSSAADLGSQFAEPHAKRAPRLTSDFRNGDFLSRLLAATPPYLYNMPLVPHSFFFSDMLKSFVTKPPNSSAGIADGSKDPPSSSFPMPHHHPHHLSSQQPQHPQSLDASKESCSQLFTKPHRRRKRSWREISEPSKFLQEHKASDKPLELTTSSSRHSIQEDSSSSKLASLVATKVEPGSSGLPSSVMDRTRSPQGTPETSTSSSIPPPPLLLPNVPPCGMLPLPGGDYQSRIPGNPDALNPDMLPSLIPNPPGPFPPPLWYPSLYPGLAPNLPPQPPYGIDPLHFFIDLRVSGHIWDRKLPFGHLGMRSPTGLDGAEKESPSETGDQSKEPDKDCDEKVSSEKLNLALNGVKQTKHTSAFSVPEPRGLTDSKTEKKEGETDAGTWRKSDDDASRKFPTTNYILQNLSKIYRDVHSKREDNEKLQEVKEETEQNQEKAESEEQEQGAEGEEAPCKDLPALIGLELVVDYVKHEGGKPGARKQCSDRDSPRSEEPIDP